MQNIDKLATDGTYANINKKERLMLDREKLKLKKLFGGISDLNRLPAALFIVDIKREHIAVAEAQKLNIPTFGIVDTNSDPTLVDYPIPANDDAAKSIALIAKYMADAITEGLAERKREKDTEADKEAIAEKEEA
jgi:small subunit ribosomal protein S2